MGLSAGRTVRLFLVDGAATGLMTAEILSWTGRALVAPRSRLPDVLKRQEARGTGVYFLVGDDPQVAGQQLVYLSLIHICWGSGAPKQKAQAARPANKPQTICVNRLRGYELLTRRYNNSRS